MSAAPERVSNSAGTRRRMPLIVGAVVLILVAVGLYLAFAAGGGSEFDSVQDLRAAIEDEGVECNPRVEGIEENADQQVIFCLGAIVVFKSDEARDDSYEKAQDGAFVEVYGGNWAVRTGTEPPVPPVIMNDLETIAEELDGELIVPN